MDNDNQTTVHAMPFEASPSIAKLSEALAKAQHKMRAASKDAENPAFKQGNRLARYANLASIWDAWRDAGPEHGLAVMQVPTGSGDGFVTIRTVLSHSSGEWIASVLTMPVTKRDAQGVGSAITYCRRYALAALVGVAPDDDDDGNAAANVDRRTQNEPPPRPQYQTQAAPQSRERSVEATDALRMISNARDVDALNKVRDFIRDKIPAGHPDRDAVTGAWKDREAALKPAARAS